MTKETMTDRQIVESILTFQTHLIQTVEDTLPQVDSLEQTKIDFPNDSKQIHYVAMMEVMRQAAMEHCLTCMLMDAFALSSNADQFARIVKIIDPDLLKSVRLIFKDYKKTEIEVALKSFLKLAYRKKKAIWLETYMRTEVFQRLYAFVTDGDSLQDGFFSTALH